jgi:hypothetical protein
MLTEPHTDTRSPWYEPFEPQEQPSNGHAPQAKPAKPATASAALTLSPMPAANGAVEDDGAGDALFDYYNA